MANPDFSGVPQVAGLWRQCRSPAVPPAGAAPAGEALTPADERVYTLIRETLVGGLRGIHLCGLQNKCLQSDLPEIEAAVANNRRRFFSKAWLADGLRAYGYDASAKLWKLGKLDRRRCREFLRSYFRHFLDPVEFTDLLARLSAQGSEFSLMRQELLTLGALTDEELLGGMEVLIAIEQDGRRLDQLQALAAQPPATPPMAAAIEAAGGMQPMGLYLLDVRPFLEAYLLLTELYLYILVPLSLRKQARVTIAQATAITYGIAALASVPVETLYENTHGSAVIEELLPRLDATRLAASAVIDEATGAIRGLVGPAVAATLSRCWSDLLALRARADCGALAKGVQTSLGRIAIGPAAVPASPITAQVPRDGAAAVELRVEPRVRFAAGPEYAEIYWMDSVLWGQFLGAALLINQSGVLLSVTAGSNRWGGRHPPHMTHRSGKEVDLDWSYYVAGTKQERTVPNLQKMERKDYGPDDPRGQFVDPGKVDKKSGRPMTFAFEPAKKSGNTAPSTQQGFDALSTWIVVQALPFSGFSRFLYSDTRNMAEALTHLKKAFPSLPVPTVWPLMAETSEVKPPVSQTALVEPEGHFDHLHAEGWEQPPFDDPASPFRIDAATLARLYALARARDADPAFRARFFPESISPTRSNVDSANWAAWETRAKSSEPALFPVWVAQAGASP